jgi:hypothetical protein
LESVQYMELFLTSPRGLVVAAISPVFKAKEDGYCCSSIFAGSSSERNSRLDRAVLNISSVMEEPLVLSGELRPSASLA